MTNQQNRRILIVDDLQSIHADFQKILIPEPPDLHDIDEIDALLFGKEQAAHPETVFDCASAFQGQDALAMVNAALAEGKPFACAFIDMRMPPGWNGLETIQKIWEIDPYMQMVICTAYSDYDFKEIQQTLGSDRDNLWIIKKPFESIEIKQSALILTNKWHLMSQLREQHKLMAHKVRTKTKSLRLALEKIQKITDFRAQFFAQITHDLKTPAHVILGVLEKVMKDPGFSADISLFNAINLAYNRARYQLELIDNAQLTNHRHAKEQDLRFQIFNPAELIYGLPEQVETLLAAKPVNFAINSHCPAQENVIGDKMKIIRILNNLLSNACRHTEKGTITLTLNFVSFEEVPGPPASPASRYLFIEVADTGTGIAAEKLDRLLDSQLKKSHVTLESPLTTGLGLYIVTEFVQLLEGEIQINSAEAAGTTIRVWLPLIQKGRILAQLDDPEHIANMALLGNKNLLVYTPNSMDRDYFQLLLDGKIQLSTVAQFSDALEALDTHDFDLVVMGQRPEAAQTASERDRIKRMYPDLSVILITAQPLTETEKHLLAFDDYLTTPIQEPELLVCILLNLIKTIA